MAWIGALLVSGLIGFEGCSVPEKADVVVRTSEGDIFIDLYDDTPMHRDNFLLLAKEGFYDGTTFHRLVKDFIIQGGDPDSKSGSKKDVGMGGPGWVVEREILPQHFHKRGAVAAARMPDLVNPEWQSSGSQFYIVQGQIWDETTLAQIEQSVQTKLDAHIRQQFEARPENQWIRTINMVELQASKPDSFAVVDAKVKQSYDSFRKKWPEYKLTSDQRAAYLKSGGAPELDAMYTVFGEVVEGMEVVDAIARGQADRSGKAHDPIKMTVEVLK
jgi:peptidyl-prolyl cis-trans isomerase B (cyclophilin B)